MAPGSDLQLSDRERSTVTGILSRFSGRLGPVKAFGSRATGTARPNSDLDLVVFPPAPLSELSALMTAFEDSDLPIKVDVGDLTAMSPGFRALVERCRTRIA